jgi:hypothetical protein
MEKNDGYSRTAKARRQRAAILSQQMRQGDSDAAFRLLQRRRALQGIAKRGSEWRVRLMNGTRAVKRRREQKERNPAGSKSAVAGRSLGAGARCGLAADAPPGKGGFRAAVQAQPEPGVRER